MAKSRMYSRCEYSINSSDNFVVNGNVSVQKLAACP